MPFFLGRGVRVKGGKNAKLMNNAKKLLSILSIRPNSDS